MKTAPVSSDTPPPAHVAIIMDGNGRWAKARGLPRTAGHKRGAESVRKVIRAAVASGVGTLTLFGFSSENWKRPENEISDLMGLLRYYLKNEIKELDKKGICLRIIGDRSRLAPDIRQLIEDSEERTRGNVKLTLVIALSYGGRAELTAAARAVAEKVKAGEMDPSEITEDVLARHLETSDLPEPDLLIRTSGEQRISNFLLWQLAYTEFVFVDTLWPDFGEAEFEAALQSFHSRERRYGASSG